MGVYRGIQAPRCASLAGVRRFARAAEASRLLLVLNASGLADLRGFLETPSSASRMATCARWRLEKVLAWHLRDCCVDQVSSTICMVSQQPDDVQMAATKYFMPLRPLQALRNAKDRGPKYPVSPYHRISYLAQRVLTFIVPYIAFTTLLVDNLKLKKKQKCLSNDIVMA